MKITRFAGSFLLAFVCLLLALPAQAARLALVIGNDTYQKVVPLKNARNDARLMAGILKKAGFDVTPANDLSRDGLWSTIDTFKGRIQKGDEVVFYFAGHGVQIGANQLLLPVDIAALNDAQVQRDGVPLLDVQEALKDARVAVLLLDACRDNPFPKTGTRAIGGTRGLSPPEPSTGQIIMMSAGRNQKALDYVPGQQQSNGLFTWELSQALQTPGVEIRAALEQVKDRVDDKARKAGHEQRPSLVNDLRGNFYLSGGKVADIAVQLSSLKPESTGNPIRSDPEEEAWLAAKGVNTSVAFDAYLTEYPNGKYAGAARISRGNYQPVAAVVPVSAGAAAPTPVALSTQKPQGGTTQAEKDMQEFFRRFGLPMPNLGVALRGRIGVMIDAVSQDVAEATGLGKAAGAWVRSVESGSAAEKAGVVAGDIITRFDGKDIDKSSDLPPLVAATAPGTAVKLTVFRAGVKHDLLANVAAADATSSAPLPSASIFGMTLAELTDGQRSVAKVRGGVSVLTADGPALKAGVQVGDIILLVDSKEVSSLKDFDVVVTAHDKSKPLSILFRRGELAQLAVIRAGAP